MNSNELAHLWANKSRESARASNFYFQGDTIFSYGSHFPIARHFKGAVLFTSKSYSVSTAKHIGRARYAANHLQTFTVSDPLRDPCGEDVREYGEQIKNEALRVARSRKPDFYLKQLERTVLEANTFCEKFGFKTRFAMPANWEELKARAAASAQKERKATAAKKAKQEREAREVVEKWLAGESVTIPHFIAKVYLREKMDKSAGLEQPAEWSLETSKGARVPLDEAQRAFRFAITRREKGWHRNGETFAVGSYQLDAVNEAGIVAGCHRIGWDEIERFAKLQGWA